MYRADVGIKESEIKEISNLESEHAEKIIDASGKYVSPGFIDVNNHSDTYWRIFLSPRLESLIYQGITTIIGGNCGSSLAPLVNENIIRTIQKWADIKKVSLNWLRMGEFLDEMQKRKLPVNFGTLAGHATMRRGLIGDEVRSLSGNELGKMKRMLRDAMREGALGFSTGLIYTHAKLASAEEIYELAEVVKDFDGVYTTHVRGESQELISAVEEAIKVSKKTGVSLHISHLKAIGSKNWHLMEEALNLIETARMDNLDVSFDIYPYTETGSVLYVFLPDWVAEGGKKLMIGKLKDPKIRKEVIKGMKADSFDYSKVMISISPLDKTLNRRKIVDIAKAQGKSVEETLIDILIASEGRVITIADVLSEKNVSKGIRNPFSIIASNGSGYDITHKETGELVHPRNFGSFPKFFSKYVRESKILSWEEAVNKVTGKPAKKFNLKRRGIIKEGNFADLVVFDPENIKDLATTDNPYQYSKGIEWVIINGKIVINGGNYEDAKAGKMIRNEKKTIFSLFDK